MGHERAGPGLGVETVAQLRVAQHEDALVGHEDVVKNRDGVHFLIAGGQRLVVGAAAVVQRGAAEVAQARGVVGDGERVRVGGVLRGAPQDRGRKHEQFVGDRGDGGEHARALDDDPVPALLHDPGRELAAELLRPGDGPVDLRRDEGVGGEHVVFPGPLVVVKDVLAKLRIRLREPLPRRAQRGQRGVHIVPGAAKEAVGGLGPGGDGAAPPLEVLDGLRHQEGGADQVPGAG
ncbi:hypothetical protein SRABI128_04399 [Microbacterium sp. Bi128]|nr:hypothetical protein SRABI128_04399 [Microbacterium sp. Bi128]